MGDTTGLLELRPVTFRYKQPFTGGERPVQYGLIAEEVAEIYPELVVFDRDGVPETVLYRFLSSMLLNELQRLHRRHELQEQELSALRVEIKQLQALESEITELGLAFERLRGRVESVAGSEPAPSSSVNTNLGAVPRDGALVAD